MLGAETLSDQCYGFMEVELTADNARELLCGLIDYVSSQDRIFDGIMGFSEGGLVAASLLVEDARHPFAGFKCGIFLNAPALPLDPNVIHLTGDGLRCLEPNKDGVIVHVPTAHISEKTVRSDLAAKSPLNTLWQNSGAAAGSHGNAGNEVGIDFAEGFVRLCEEELREFFLHEIGHQVPGSRSSQGLSGALWAMERTIQKAKALSS